MNKIAHYKWRSLPKYIKSLIKNEEGSLMPLVASSVMMLTGVAGLSIDGSRMFLVKDVLQKSLDSAGLAAGHAMEIDDMATDAQEFFDANIAAVEDIVSDSGMTIDISEDNSLITLTATAKVKASFTSLFGYDEITVSASTEITRETRGMELVLVMDNTGSMRHSGKIDAAKDAAEQLVQLVYGDEDTSNNLWVGVVPYITHVNVGKSHEDWLTTSGQARIDNGDYRETEWKGCVLARSGGEDLTDTPPTEIPFSPWFWEDEPYISRSNEENNWIDDDGDVTINETNSRSYARSPNRGCAQPLLPLVESKAKVLDAIEEMEPWSFGGTATPVGLVWGWRVLSAKWQGLWGGDTPNELPLAKDTPYMDKVLIVLTDGKNELISRRSSLGYSDYTAYGTIQDWGYTSTSTARDELDDRFAEICSNIKDDGIIIYGITFGSSPDSATRNDFETCASKPAYYFHAPSNSELQDVFDAIGRQLSNLRLSK
ncbi:MAG: pilus assembly protein TadG-related protein [Kordiimonas sp.]